MGEAGLVAQTIHPDALAQQLGSNASAVVIDAASSIYDEDELLAAVGLARATRTPTAVSMPDSRAFTGIEDLLDDLCGGLIVRPGAGAEAQQRRVASVLARRRDGQRAKRFEYLTVSPRTAQNELLAVLGDGSALLLARPVADDDDGSEVKSIALQGDAQTATLTLGSGRELTLRASTIAGTSQVNGHKPHVNGSNGASGVLAIDGARLGARLRELRLAAGLTQAELARRTGIHRPNIARVEAGRHTPSLETLARLASAIGVSTTVVLAE
ncbi:MAG TPA: helix-turn-helix transcriptional regulator [Polyangiales bacterium]|nr:helix-turn-helix transcriptional regulator [Polyangiales bacterium]